MSGGGSSVARKGGVPRSRQPITGAPPAGTRDLALWTYGAALGLGTLCLITLAVISKARFGPFAPTAVMALAAFVSEKRSVRLGPNLEASVAFLPGLFSVVALGPISAIVVAAVGLLATFGRPWERWLIWTGSRCLIYGWAALAVLEIGNKDTLGHRFLAVGAASVIVITGEALTGAITVHIRCGFSSVRPHLLEMTRVTLGMIVYVPVIAGLAYVYEELSAWAVVLFIGPAVAAQLFFVLYRNQQTTTAALTRAVRKLERVNLSFATALITALDARDHYTAGHSAEVAAYARDIANHIGLSNEERENAHLCGLLHDIGKIGIPAGVLEKKGPLAQRERIAIETHASVGASILARVEGYETIAQAVKHHHERYDGSGYPDRLKGEAIPLIARIVSVADAYSAMTSERPYRGALTRDEARERLKLEAGKQFDPEIVKAFVLILEREGEEYAKATDKDFELDMAEFIALERERYLAVSR
jgi:putative nucleotidyltransferase with HDIG domain